MADTAINRPTARAKLAPRNQPYWRQISKGTYIGFRKSATGDERWQAKFWDPATQDRRHKSLGPVTPEFGYEQAKAAAEAWAEARREGVDDKLTVEGACREYVKNQRSEKRDISGDQAEMILKPTIYDTDFGRIPLAELTTHHVRRWRDRLIEEKRRHPGRARKAGEIAKKHLAKRKEPKEYVRGKVTANRILRSFKAAMNFALHEKLVMRDDAWRHVKAFKAQARQREAYLTLAQRRAILGSATPDYAYFLKGILHTGARPNEIAEARVKDLDPATKTLRLVSYKGDGTEKPRKIGLTSEALTFFKDLSKSKLPNAYLVGEFEKQHWCRELKRAIKRAKAADPKLELPDEVVPYTFRHVTISDWLASGQVDVATVAKRAGTSIIMIDKHYHKYIPSNVAEKLENVQVI